MFGAIASIAVGTWIRIAVVAIAIGIVTYGVHLYNDSVRESQKLKYEAQLAAKDKEISDAIAINATLRSSLAETERKVDLANAAVEEFRRISEHAAKDATDAVAKARANAVASKAATDALIAKAKGPPTPGTQAAIWAEADRILTEYATDIAKAREVLGLK